MSKSQKHEKAKAEVQVQEHEALRARAAAVNVQIDSVLEAGLVAEAEVMVAAVEAQLKAEAEAARAGRSANRFDLFRRRIHPQLEKNGKPSLVEDKEYHAGLTELYPHEGRGGGSSDWANKGVAKCLAILSWYHSKGINWNSYFAAYTKVCEGAKDGKATAIMYLP